MNIQNKIILALLIASGVIILFAMIKSKHFFKGLFFSFLQGFGSLFAVNLLSGITGISLAVNWGTLAISALGGIPGVILMLAARFMLTQ